MAAVRCGMLVAHTLRFLLAPQSSPPAVLPLAGSWACVACTDALRCTCLTAGLAQRQTCTPTAHVQPGSWVVLRADTRAAEGALPTDRVSLALVHLK